MCRVISCVVGRGCLLDVTGDGSNQCILLLKLLVFALLHFVLQGQICPLLQVSLDFLLWHSRPLDEKDNFFGVLVLEGLVGLHGTVQF